jgi:hypothetical protein
LRNKPRSHFFALLPCIVKCDEQTGEAVSSGRAWLKLKGKNDANPKSIQLCNFPKTKDFRTEADKQSALTVPSSPIGVLTDVPVDSFKADSQENYTETFLQPKTSETSTENISRENDLKFILEMSNLAKNHILQNEWTEFNLKQLRLVNKFKEHTDNGSFLKTSEVKAIISFLIVSGFLIETASDNFRVVSLSNSKN